jgi:hypothetical protein
MTRNLMIMELMMQSKAYTGKVVSSLPAMDKWGND